jgi:2-keto-3-deoxy-L-arabinonate dehydratase
MSETNARHVNGIVPIVPTPSTIEELIDWPSLRRLVDFACATRARVMCLPAYASEFHKLSESERLQLVAEAVRQAADPLPVLAQVNFVFLHQAVETARELKGMGASGLPRHSSLLSFNEGVLKA